MTALAKTTAYMLGIFSLIGFVGWGWRGLAAGTVLALALVAILVWTLGGDD